jgi:hypothetical protein
MSNENNIKITIRLSVKLFMFVLLLIIIFYGGPILYVEIMPWENTTEAVGALSSFYSMAFTIVAIIIGIIGLVGWQWLREGKEKLEEFKEVKSDVEFLKRKSELAKWVQSKFDEDAEKKISSETDLPISSPEDLKKYEDIKEHIINEATDDSWLKIVYAKKLMEKANNRSKNIKRFSNEAKDKKQQFFLDIKNIYKRVKKIFEFVDTRDLFRDGSDIETTLHNLHGKVYWELYKLNKLEHIYEDKAWKDWWINGGKQYKMLESSIKYYKKALDIADQKADSADETLGNLALVLIELSKFSPTKKESIPILEEAQIQLKKKTEVDFNSYWDHAKALYYINPSENKKEIREKLDNTVNEINNKKDKNFFIERLEAEIAEEIREEPGFPGDDKTIIELKSDLNEKNLS